MRFAAWRASRPVVMMPRPVRQLLTAFLLGLHVVVTQCGVGLHALPGLGHDSGLRPLAQNDHSHGPGKSAHESAEDCPVCQFLAQGQLHHEHFGTAVAWLALDATPPPPPPLRVFPPLSPAAPRAPPARPDLRH